MSAEIEHIQFVLYPSWIFDSNFETELLFHVIWKKLTNLHWIVFV